MAEYRFSQLAEADANSITAYTIATWSIAQADRYIGGLEAFCQGLAEGLNIGRACDEIAPGLYRLEYVSHVVFYRPKPYGVRVVRVLHQSQLPELHGFEDEGTEEHE